MLVYVLYKEGLKFHKLRPHLSTRTIDLYWVYLTAMFLIFYGSLEAIKLNAEGGPRSILAIVVVCVAFKTALHGGPIPPEKDGAKT